ncbi:hypothetical protein FPV67DRAFT_1491857 [Lyophyllum atratum]|nr:hypothetical protein FPV67DRAFT_1491857 [Lyophyllum atratum]
MVQNTLHPQSHYPWRPSDGERAPLQYPALYDTNVAAQTMSPTDIPAPSSGQWTSPPMITITAVAHHPHPQVAGYALSSASASVAGPSTSRRLPASSPAASGCTTTRMSGLSPSWVTESAPPPHTRSLYATIPLPHDDNLYDFGGYSTQKISESRRAAWTSSSSSSSSLWFTAPPPPPNPNPADFPSTSKRHSSPRRPHPIHLHTSLQNACLSPSSSSQHTLHRRSRVPQMLTNWGGHRDDPATTPSVGDLTVMLGSTGQTVYIRPTSHLSPYVVTVGDVLDGLGAAFLTSDNGCRRRCRLWLEHAPACIGERLLVASNTLQVWWRMPAEAEAGSNPWQLVTRRR